MAFVAYHDDFAVLRVQPRHFFVYLRYQRAGGVEHAETARLGFFLYGFGHAVRRVNQGCAGRHFGQVFDKDRTFFAQIVHHEFIVHHFMTHINRRAEFFQRALHDTDGPIDTGAEAARVGQNNGFFRHCV